MKENSIQEEVVKIFQEQTLYEKSELLTDLDMESDLGIDSIVLESVLGDIRRRFHLDTKQLSSGGYQTIGDIIQKLGKLDISLILSEHNTSNSPDIDLQNQSKASPSDDISSDSNKLEQPKERITSNPEAQSRHQNLLKEIEVILGQKIDQINERTPLFLEGMTESQHQSLFKFIQKKLDIVPKVSLESCDTIDKLLSYLNIANKFSIEKIPTPDTSDEKAAHLQSSYDTRTMKDFVEIRDKNLFKKTGDFFKFYRTKQKEGHYWYGMPSEGLCTNRITIYDEIVGKKREFLNFASNNYLGLASHPKVIKAIQEAAKQHGSTNTGCRIIGGTNSLHKTLERKIARLKKRASCIVFPSGYSANLGTISALIGKKDAIISDKYNHMSINDGCQLSGGIRRIYRHDDMEDLENVLRKTSEKSEGMLIATDGVFSMHGNICNLPKICQLARKYSAKVLVDDAHSTGVLGRTGAGTSEYYDMPGIADLELGTMSKALAGMGGFVVGDEEVIEYLRFYANSYVFAATIPATIVAGLIASLEIMENEPERLSDLWQNIHYLRNLLTNAGFNLDNSNSAIIPVVFGDETLTLNMGKIARSKGLFCQTVVFPGVSVGDARLRLSISSEHTIEDLDRVADILLSASKSLGILESGSHT